MSDISERIADLSPEKLKLFLRELNKKSERDETSQIYPQPRDVQVFPLSFAQQRLWFLSQLEPDSIAYLVPNSRRLTGPMSIEGLERSLEEVVRRHEILRTTFAVQADQPVQIIHSPTDFSLPVIDLSALGQEACQKETQQLATQEAQQPCDLVTGPLLRARIIRLKREEHLLLLTVHHIIADGWSNEILFRELTQLYRAFITRKAIALPPLPIQYADFAVWQRQWLQGEVLASQLTYWKHHLAGSLPLELSTDHPRPPVQTYRGATRSVHLPSTLREQLMTLAQQEDVTLFMLLLAAFQVLLARYTGQSDISVGTPVANRNRAELERLIGFFVNTLVLRVDLGGNPSFLQLLARVREVALGAYAHQEIPFEYLVEVLQPERDLSRSPLFQVMFSFEQVSVVAGEKDEKGGSSNFHVEITTAKFDLTLSIIDSARGISSYVEYNTDLFDEATIQRLLRHWEVLLKGIVACPATHISDLPLLTHEEEQQFSCWNNTRQDVPGDLCFQQLFERQAGHIADAIALVYEDQQLTYGALERRANQLAHALLALDVEPGVLIGICLRRSLELVVAILGVLKSGAAYMPLDPMYPAERVRFMLDDAQASMLITQKDLVNTLPLQNVVVVCLDDDQGQIERADAEAVPCRVSGDNIAYIIYTSGSTGTPKGVMVPHSNLVNAYYGWEKGYQLHDRCRTHLQMANFSFDVFTGDLARALCSGARMVLCPQELLLEVEQLYRLMQEQYVDSAEFVPAVLRNLLAYLQESQQRLDFMQTLVVGSDRWYGKEHQDLRKLCGAQTWLVNSYGVTEATIDSSYFAGPLSGDGADGIVPIGRPFANVHLYLLDAYLQPVPVGCVGELYIGGSGLAWGYRNWPELTATRFIPHPYSHIPGERLYKTGDLARYQADGTIVCIGRVDHQVKVRGYRIELEEIEAVLLKYQGVRECVVLVDPAGENHLITYLAGEIEKTTHALQNVRKYLQEHLPHYMVPSFLLVVDALPLTPNGKVDRQSLPAFDMHEVVHSDEVEAARTPLEEILLGSWCEVLRCSYAGIHDNFFASGGHSLLATRLIARVRSALMLDVPLRYLFEEPTVAGLAQRIEALQQQQQNITQPPLLPVARPRDFPLSFVQERLWLFEQLEPNTTTYIVPGARRLHGMLNVAGLERSIATLIQRHESLRTTFQMRGEQPVQVIHPAVHYHLPLVDLRGLETTERYDAAQRLIAQENQLPFNLVKGPLVRTLLIVQEMQEYVLLLTRHHIITDAWSDDVFYRELVTLYKAFVAGQPVQLPSLPVQYADFALWQRQWLQGQVLEEQVTYWKQQLANVTPLALPVDHPRPPIPTYRGAAQAVLVPSSQTQALKALSQRENVTLFMTLLTAFQALLARYTGQEDICVGIPITNRSRPELEGVIGFFLNMLVMRADLSTNPSFQEMLQRARGVVLDAYMHQELPYEYLLEVISPERDISRSPLFQVAFTLQQSAEGAGAEEHEEHGELRWHGVHTGHVIAKFELSMVVVETDRGLLCNIEYNTDLFEAATIRRMVEHWQRLLEGVVATPQIRLADLPLLSESERRTLLVEWNDTQSALPPERLPHIVIEKQALQNPDSIAVVQNETCITYACLDGYSNQLAQYMQRLGCGSGALVGLYIEQSVEGVIAIIAILKAGCVYIPLEPATPRERLDLLLEEAQITALITRQQFYERLPQRACMLLSIEQIWDKIAKQPEEYLHRVEISAEQLAYIMYTSGSTGRPKGVMIPHAAIFNRLWWGISSIGLQSGDRHVQIASWGFDIALWELFAPLMSGATCVLVPAQEVKDPSMLIQRIQEQQATVVHMVPSLLALLLREQSVAACRSVRSLLCGGEAVSVELVQRVFITLAVPVFQFYGPTESAISVTCWQGVPEEPLERISIGRPIANTSIYLLDSALQPVPIGVYGELCIGGRGLAWGYYQRPEQTAEFFIPDAWSGTPGARLYRTGDIARYLPSGEIEFGGRRDNQVKIRGYRVEPGEVEVVLLKHALVSECVVVVREDGSGDKSLVAYIVGGSPETSLSVSELRAYMQERVPHYMLPSHIVVLNALPLTTNGKVDRRKLPDPFVQESEEPLAARNVIEELLAQIWCDLLQCSSVGLEDDFFVLGGHSLLAVRLVSRLRSILQVEIPMRELFDASTFSDMARLIELALQEEYAVKKPPLVPIARTEDLPLSFAQQRLWFLDRLEPGNVAYLIPFVHRLRGTLNMASVERALQELLLRHESLRTTFSERAGRPVQVIHVRPVLSLPIIDLSWLAHHEAERCATQLAMQESVQPCDLVKGPLWRVSVVRLGMQEHRVMITMHHIITDGWSHTIFMRELHALYQSAECGLPSTLPSLPIQYVDYAVWQRNWLQGDVLRTELDFWRKQLANASELQLPVDRPYPSRQSHRGALHRFQLPLELSDALRTFSQQENATLFMTILSVFQILLYRYTGQMDIIVGTDSANRNYLEVEGIIGFFINLLPLRTDLRNNPSFRTLLQQVRQTVLAAYMHQETPFDLLVERLVPDHSSRRMPLIQALFVLQNFATAGEIPFGERVPVGEDVVEDVSQFDIDSVSSAKFDLALFMQERHGSLHGGLTYNLDVFNPATIATMMKRFVVLLQCVVRQSDTPIDSLEFLTEAERKRLAKRTNEIRFELPAFKGERFDLSDPRSSR